MTVKESTLATEIICYLSAGACPVEEMAISFNKPLFIIQDAVMTLALEGKINLDQGLCELRPEFKDLRPMPKPWWKQWLDGLFGGSMSQCEYCSKKIDKSLTVNGLCGECYRESQRWGA